MEEEERVVLEKEAKELGWVPKDQFRGPEDQWRDADEFVARGREILPIVKANNRKLLGELNAAKGELGALKGTLTQQQQTMKDLLEHQASEIKRQVESRLMDLRAEKKAAIKGGDHDLAADLEEEIDKTKDRLAEANKPKAATPAPAPTHPQAEPWAQAFGEANDEWLGKDKRKTALFMGICEDLMTTTQLRATDLLEEAKKQTEQILDKTPSQRMASKSESGGGGWEGSSNGGGGRAPGGKSFKDLPQEAKDTCKAQAAKFVGENGKAFKTNEAWQQHYAETFFASQR